MLMLVKMLGSLPLQVARGMGFLVGVFLWTIRGRAYRITSKNIALCYPQMDHGDQLTLVRESLIETAKTAFEACIIWCQPWSSLKIQIVKVENEALLLSELNQKKGLLVLTPHIGNWEIVGPYLASIAPLTAMYKPFQSKAVEKIIRDGRSKININMVPTSRKGVCSLMQTLKQGAIVGILLDQIPLDEAGGEPAQFFNHLAMTITLVHSLIRRTQCRVVYVFAIRVSGGYRIVTLPVDASMYSENTNESLGAMNLGIENCVAMAPAQYQWEYNRFRRYFADQNSDI